MRRLLDILTPENVYVEYELAGLGSRILAGFVDSFVQVLLTLLVFVIMLAAGISFETLDWLSSTVIAIGIAIIFIIWFGYYIFFEMLMNGQSPGKRLVNLRVVRETGEPVTFFDSFLRNILRVADMLPSFYLAGGVFLIFTKKYKRIGDFAANTIVVKIGEVKKEENSLENLILSYNHGIGLSAGKAAVMNVYPVNNLEYGILKEFLMRRNELGSRYPAFIDCLSKYFMGKFMLKSIPFGNPVRFFETIVSMNSGM